MIPPPSISIILPTYCRAASGHLTRAVESVLAQDHESFELIAVDDGSVDGTRGILEEFARKDKRVTYVRVAKHVGLPAIGTAHGYTRSRAELITWMFDDCELLPQSLSRRFRAFAANPAVDMVYGRAELRQADEQYAIGRPIDRDALSRADNMIPNIAVMLRRRTVEMVGWYDPNVLLKRFCDWDLWCRVLKAERRIEFLDEILAIESGTGLENSLGRSTPLEVELMLRYAKTDRNIHLQPAAVIQADPFREDWDPSLDDDARYRLRLLATDHCCRNGQFDLLRKLVRRWNDVSPASVKPGDGEAMPPRSELEWVAELYRRERDRMSKELVAVGTDLRKTLAICDERLTLLHKAEGAVAAADDESKGAAARAAQAQAELSTLRANAELERRQYRERAAMARRVLRQRIASLTLAVDTAASSADRRLFELGTCKSELLELQRQHAASERRGASLTAEIDRLSALLATADAQRSQLGGKLHDAEAAMAKLEGDVVALRRQAALAWRDAAAAAGIATSADTTNHVPT